MRSPSLCPACDARLSGTRGTILQLSTRSPLSESVIAFSRRSDYSHSRLLKYSAFPFSRIHSLYVEALLLDDLIVH